MEHNANCGTIEKIRGNSKFADVTFNLNKNCQENSSQSNKHNVVPYTIRKHSQFAELSVVTPEQSKFFRPVDRTILSMITEGDPDLTTYLKELLRTNKPEQQKSTSGFQHLKILVKMKITTQFRHEYSENLLN